LEIHLPKLLPEKPAVSGEVAQPISRFIAFMSQFQAGRRISSCPTSNGAPAADHVNQEDNDGDHKENVNEAADRVRANHPKQPQHEQYNENCPKHNFSFPANVRAIQSPSCESASTQLEIISTVCAVR